MPGARWCSTSDHDLSLTDHREQGLSVSDLRAVMAAALTPRAQLDLLAGTKWGWEIAGDG
jgi:hypothetical protein